MKLITLDLGDRTAAAVALSEDTARIFGSRAEPDFPDVGALLLEGLLGDLDALAARPGTETSYTGSDLAAPILEPGAVFCVGLNYRSHILEMGRPLPPAPTVFDKLPRALTRPHAELLIPKAGAQALDYEGELCVVIGTAGRDIPLADALDHVAGYTVFNDITMRDFQKRSMQWFAGKSWQESTPWGPALVTADECADLDERRMLVTVNGETRQQAELGDLVFGVADLVSDLSTIVELQPGDLIATGTPGGVGEAMSPRGYLTGGDVVEVSISGLGRLRNEITVS